MSEDGDRDGGGRFYGVRRIRETFDGIAEDFDRTRTKAWPECIRVAETIPSGSMLLDLGCGNGRNMAFLARRHRVIGLDISRRMLALARRNVEKERVLENCAFIESDMHQLPIADSRADFVFFIAALHHVPSEEGRLRCMGEVRRVLRPDGRALVSVWALDQPKFERLMNEREAGKAGPGDVVLHWKRKDGKTFERLYHLFLGGELDRLVAASGLTVESSFKSNDNYYAIARRSAKD